MYLNKGSVIGFDIGITSQDIMEYTLNLEKEFLKKFSISITNNLNKLGYITKDCTPWNKQFLSFGDCIKYKVREINGSLSKIHLSLEINNKKSKSIKSFVGEKDFKEEKIAKNIECSFKKLGFLDLGVNHSDIYAITNTFVPCIIIRIDCDVLEFERDDIMLSALSKTLVDSIINLGTI